jgi:hypothetical protein
MPWGLLAALAGLIGGAEGYKKGRDLKHAENFDMLMKISSLPIEPKYKNALAKEWKVNVSPGFFEAGNQQEKDKGFFEASKEIAPLFKDDPQAFGEFVTGYQKYSGASDQIVDITKKMLTKEEPQEAKTYPAAQTAPLTGIGKDMIPPTGQDITVQPPSKLTMRGTRQRDIRTLKEGEGLGYVDEAGAWHPITQGESKPTTPHTVKLFKDKNGNPTKEPHEWQWNQKTGQYDVYVGKAGVEKKKKEITDRLDLGDKIHVWYADGTEEFIKKGLSPSAAVTVNMMGQFGKLPQDTQDVMYQQYETDKTLPPFAWRDAKSRNDFIKGYGEWLKRQGRSGVDVLVDRAAYTAEKQALNMQEKTYGMMGQFVGNLNKQITRVKQITKDTINRVGVRALDLPIRELNTRFVGSGHERVLESYLMEISREIGKLSTGSQASVAELSVEAQKRWDKIHDANLSLKDLEIILNATQEQANIRRSTALENINESKVRMREGVKSGQSPLSPPVKGGKKPSEMSNDELLKALSQ